MARRARPEGNATAVAAGSSSSTRRSMRTSEVPVEEPTPWLVVSSAPRAVPSPAAPDLRLRRSSFTVTPADDAEPVEEKGVSRSLESFPASFASWDELDAYVREFGESTFQLFRKRTTVSVAKRNQDITKRVQERKALRNFKRPELIPEVWEFYCKTFVCTHGLKNYPRGDGRRTHTSVRDTGCTARIHATLKLDKNSGAYGISARVSGAHNHAISRERYLSYAENRKITDPELLRDIADMSVRGELPKAILAHITQRMREMTGEDCTYDLKAVRNIIWRLKHEQTAAAKAIIRSTAVIRDNARPGRVTATTASELVTMRTKRKTESSPQVESEDGSAEEELQHRRRKHQLHSGEDSVRLSRLEILLNTSYTYTLIQKDVGNVAIAAAEMIPNTISGFEYEVVELYSSSSQRPTTVNVPEDVTFVLPKHALVGCENGIVSYCESHNLLPQSVGVRLPVRVEPGATHELQVCTLSSRQLLVMKRYYVARHSICHAKQAMAWIHATSFTAYPSAPFDEYVNYSKDLLLLSIELLPLSTTVVRGTTVVVDDADNERPFAFTDTIYGSNLLHFASSNGSVDMDCMKAILLHMHARFHTRASFVCPSFALEATQDERKARASGYGAFLSPNDVIAGLYRLQSSRWGGFLLDCAKKTCYLYAPSDAEYHELQTDIRDLFVAFGMRVDFEVSPSPPLTSTCANDSGILALLFVECMLVNKTWGDSPMDSLDYFRVRFLMQAIQVVNKQDVHTITW
ncbi:hypothetical protein FI667_g9674, partial [Globisporangium splendens]